MCECKKDVNKKLASSNARIAEGFSLNRNILELLPAFVMLEKVNERTRSKLPYMLASHCPFCGEKYPPSESA